MCPTVLASFKGEIPSMRRRWEELLRVEPPSTALAAPDIIVHLVPDTLNDLMEFLTKLPANFSAPEDGGPRIPSVDCGWNPYRTFYVAGEQAVTEGFIHVQAKLPAEERSWAEMASVVFAVRQLARCDVEAFCGVCVHRDKCSKCWQHAPRTPHGNEHAFPVEAPDTQLSCVAM